MPIFAFNEQDYYLVLIDILLTGELSGFAHEPTYG